MSEDRYNNNKGTAPEVDPTKRKRATVDKSDFNLSRPVFFKTIDGLIVPFDCFRVVPNSSYDLKYRIKTIMTNPYVRQLASGKRAYIHVYHSSLSDLWEGAPEFIKKGRDFNTELKIPTLNHIVKDGSKLYETITAGSPAVYLDLPVARYDTTKSPLENIKPIKSDTGTQITDYSNFEFSALKLVMFQQIYQAHYLNKNLVNSNKAWLPQVENHFILPLEASGESVSRLSYDIDTAKDNAVQSDEDFDFNSDYFVPRDVTEDNPTNKSNAPLLNAPRFRQFKGDMFISGSPFADLMRGDTPVMSFADLIGTIDWTDVLANSAPTGRATVYHAGDNDNKGLYLSDPSASFFDIDNLKATLDKAVVTVQNQLSFNLNALRALDVYTLLGERAARTDGTYNDYIKSMFDVDPHLHSHEPQYLGGFYIDFVNQTIDQTSETGTTPLGTATARAQSDGTGSIGKFSYNDHGYIMAIMDIVDETVYTGGVDRDWTNLTFDSQYVPLMNGLAPQATLQQELYLTGVKADNEDVFNYVERYSDYKSRRAKALGQMSLPAYSGETPIDLDSAAYLHKRNFKSKVEFNNKFVTMTPKNIDMSPYSSVEDYPFFVTADCYNDAVLPFPYITVPSGLAIMA